MLQTWPRVALFATCLVDLHRPTVGFAAIGFLTDVMGMTSVAASYPGVATYHDSCSGLRELGLKEQPRALLAGVAELELREMRAAVARAQRRADSTRRGGACEHDGRRSADRPRPRSRRFIRCHATAVGIAA